MGATKKPNSERHISYLLEIIATNRFYGQHILLNTCQDAEALNILPSSIRTMKCFPNPVLRGMKITGIPRTTGIIPGQQEIIKHFLRYPMMYNLRHHPVIGDILTGPFKGKKIALFTVKEIKHHFSIDAIRIAAPKQSIYGDIRWQNADRFIDAENIYCLPDQPYLLSVFRRRYKYADKPLTMSQHEAFQETVNEVSKGLSNWYLNNDVVREIPADQIIILARWCQRLDEAIQCQMHYNRIRDTLLLLQDILAKGNRIKPLLFIGHCKILERLAKETLPAECIIAD